MQLLLSVSSSLTVICESQNTNFLLETGIILVKNYVAIKRKIERRKGRVNIGSRVLESKKERSITTSRLPSSLERFSLWWQVMNFLLTFRWPINSADEVNEKSWGWWRRTRKKEIFHLSQQVIERTIVFPSFDWLILTEQMIKKFEEWNVLPSSTFRTSTSNEPLESLSWNTPVLNNNEWSWLWRNSRHFPL